MKYNKVMENKKIELLMKQMKKEIKEELRKEIIQELKGSVKNAKGKDFDFDAYKDQVVADDIKKAEEFLKVNNWYWYIPIIGYMIYAYQMNQVLTSIDRGILRKKINKASLVWLWLDVPFTWIVPVMLIINYWPGRTKNVLRRAIEMTKGQVE